MDFLIQDNDLVIQNNNLVLVDGLEETRQRLTQRLQTFFSEWFLDRRRGIPHIQEIRKKGVQQSTVSAIFKKEILDVEGVTELLKFEMDYIPSSRTLVLDFAIRSNEGTLELTIPFS
ncbi:MAG: hypothetical protein GY710_24435 [Desulfobacteraceae bacterium]|nr:hypothetical protein [Desulfobacteraceae bacterium]